MQIHVTSVVQWKRGICCLFCEINNHKGQNEQLRKFKSPVMVLYLNHQYSPFSRSDEKIESLHDRETKTIFITVN